MVANANFQGGTMKKTFGLEMPSYNGESLGYSRFIKPTVSHSSSIMRHRLTILSKNLENH